MLLFVVRKLKTQHRGFGAWLQAERYDTQAFLSGGKMGRLYVPFEHWYGRLLLDGQARCLPIPQLRVQEAVE